MVSSPCLGLSSASARCDVGHGSQVDKAALLESLGRAANAGDRVPELLSTLSNKRSVLLSTVVHYTETHATRTYFGSIVITAVVSSPICSATAKTAFFAA